jgi:transposase-like protein
MQCFHCQSAKVIKNGKYRLQDGSAIQHYLCKACNKRFSDKTGTPMARLRTPTSLVSIALKMRGEGMGVRASSRVVDKSHSTILGWETRMAAQAVEWSPPAPQGGDVTLEHDELYTHASENLPPLQVARLNSHMH